MQKVERLYFDQDVKVHGDRDSATHMDNFSCLTGEITVSWKPIPHGQIFVRDDSDAAAYAREVIPELYIQEHLVALYFSSSNQLVAHSVLSSGAINGAMFPWQKFILQMANCLACGIIIVHNHPSGNLKASDSDRAMAHGIKTILKHMNVKLLDFIIITPDSHTSFSSEGEI
jgi:DNA repair protein RadC